MPLNYASVDLEYEKNKELRRDDVRHLQDWLEKLPHMPEISELELIFFLKSCEFRVEMTKTTIDNCYTMKGLSPEIFARRDLKTLQATLDNVILLPLPKLTSEGYQVFYTKLNSEDPSLYVFADMVKCNDVVMRVTLLQKGTVAGLVYIFDMEGFTLSHIARMHITELRKVLFYLQDGLPMQLVQFHFINADSRLDKLMMIIKPFLKKKLFERMHFHTDPAKTLYEYVPQECMPKEFGGLDRSIRELQDEVRARLNDTSDFIEEDEKRVIDESKRLQKSSRFDHVFGMEGTFKKLELD
ncbi:alpha-tocopherol transfer protein-like [Photinus pyralis]|nr:alpha-tocopherol transfer protein-like [Photinus pyralis]